MSSFYCESCGLPCLGTPKGYDEGCVHHPPNGWYRSRYETCKTCGRIASDVADRRSLEFPETRFICYDCHTLEQLSTEDFG